MLDTKKLYELGVDPSRARNLLKLADYLLALPGDYCHFDMQTFLSGGVTITPKHAKEHKILECGTSGCAVGHSYHAGVVPWDQPFADWWHVINEYYICEWAMEKNPQLSSPLFRWLFDSAWEVFDNTPRGAGTRIYWFFQHGIPADAREQMIGVSSLCYTTGFDPALYYDTFRVVFDDNFYTSF